MALTKEDLQAIQALLEPLQAGQKAIQADITDLKQGQEQIREDIADLKLDVKLLWKETDIVEAHIAKHEKEWHSA